MMTRMTTTPDTPAHLDPGRLQASRRAWEAADRQGRTGERVSDGLAAVDAYDAASERVREALVEVGHPLEVRRLWHYEGLRFE